MKNEPATHEELTKEFNEILSPFKAESMSPRCADIVVRERIKMLQNTVDHVERIMDKLEIKKSHSDKSTGEWINPNPHTEEQRE